MKRGRPPLPDAERCDASIFDIVDEIAAEAGELYARLTPRTTLTKSARSPLTPGETCLCGCGFVQPRMIKSEIERIWSEFEREKCYSEAASRSRRPCLPVTVNRRLRRLAAAHESRARKYHADWDSVDLGRVYLHHKGICGLCNEPVSADVVTFDHEIPLIIGGSHVWENLQLAHFDCNSRKGAAYGETRPEAPAA